MIVKASNKSVRMSPRKVGEVVALIRGRTVQDALTILEHTPRAAAKPVTKLINSAAANAENNHGLDVKTLDITHISVGPGLTMKRFRPAAHGRALPYRKRSSIIVVEVEGQKKATKKKPVKADTKSKAKKATKTDDEEKA